MLWSIVVAFLAALGIVLLGFLLAGILLLPACGNGHCILYVKTRRDCRCVRSFCFLQDSGLCRMPLIVVDDGLSADAQQWLQKLSARREIQYVSRDARMNQREME